jgi:hypothetical protein
MIAPLKYNRGPERWSRRNGRAVTAFDKRESRQSGDPRESHHMAETAADVLIDALHDWGIDTQVRGLL